jgi:hypothetical protein
MFGSDIIRIKVKGYLRNITDNEIFEFEERGIKNKDKITFNNNDIKYSIKCNDNEIMILLILLFLIIIIVKVTIYLKRMVMIWIWKLMLVI